jgi:uncharacterized phage infection (PIP) family protein YhgE
MSCGLNEQQQEVLDKLTSLSSADGIFGILDAFPLPFPTTGQGIAEALGVGAQYATLTTEIQKVEQFITDIENGMLPIPDNLIPPELKSLQSDVQGFIDKVKPLASSATDVILSAEQIANEVNNLKTKWGDVDLGDGGIENLPNLIKSGAVDLETLCKKIPNLQKSLDGLSNVLKGTPITAPEEPPEDVEEGEPVPEIPKPSVTQDFERRAKEIADEFADIEPPKLFDKLQANERMKILQQITGAIDI